MTGLASRLGLFVDAHLGGVASAGEAAEGVLDWQFIDVGGVVVLEPFHCRVVTGMVGVGSGVEQVIIAR